MIIGQLKEIFYSTRIKQTKHCQRRWRVKKIQEGYWNNKLCRRKDSNNNRKRELEEKISNSKLRIEDISKYKIRKSNNKIIKNAGKKKQKEKTKREVDRWKSKWRGTLLKRKRKREWMFHNIFLLHLLRWFNQFNNNKDPILYQDKE